MLTRKCYLKATRTFVCFQVLFVINCIKLFFIYKSFISTRIELVEYL